MGDRVHDARAWDARAGTDRWLRSDEVVVWRGAPDASVVFAPQDAFLVPVSVIWTVLVVLILEAQDTSAVGNLGSILAGVVVAAGAYIVIGRFAVKRWSRRHTWYAVTTARAVEVSGFHRSVREAPLTVPVEIRRARRGHHATAIWPLAPDDPTTPALFRSLSGPGTLSPEWFRGTGWPGGRRWARPEVAFCDVADAADLERAVRQVGFSVEEGTAAGWPRAGARSTEPGPGPPADGPSRRRAPWAGAGDWVGERLRRRPYALWTPLEPAETARRLAGALAPVPTSSFGLRRSGSRYQGSVTGGAVRMICAADGRNSWRYEFDGGIAVQGPGSWLTGTLGPPGVVPLFCAAWVGLVSLVFVVGTVGLIVDAATAHGLSWLPAVLVPAGMLGFFVVVVEVASRSAAGDWQQMERWLRRLLDVPDASPA